MSTATIDRFLGDIARILREHNGAQLKDYMVIEPPFRGEYEHIVAELNQAYPVFNQSPLEKKVNSFVPDYEEGDEGGSNASFIAFIVKYFTFIRDVDPTRLVETHDMLKSLLNQCTLALSASNGLVVLPTVIFLSQRLARLAIDLDKRPDLIAHLIRRKSDAENNETTERITMVEDSANVIREAFGKCLSERSGNALGLDSNGKPAGRRVGIYVTANICLKLFFRCKKLRNAETMFGNIYQQSPPLALFPTAQRVTYLYYVGRYLFANNHFHRAQLTLQAAYNQCHRQALKQRHLILIYLLASNVILGRFPSGLLLQRPEARGLAERFQPLCRCIVKGDLASFRQLLDLGSDDAGWFLGKRILLQLSNRCEVLVWRSLARKTFLLSGTEGNASNKRAPTLDLQDMLVLARFLERRALGLEQPAVRTPHTNSIFMAQNPTQGSGESEGYVDPDLAGAVEPGGPDLSSIETIESVVASLVEQDLLHGFISHKSLRFAITGSKTGGALAAGFPEVWDVIKGRVDDEVPGWVKESPSNRGGAPGGMRAGPGMVVNLSGARPAGAASA